jgi:hypothetical protein
VVGDKGEDAVARLLDAPLCEAYELDVVVVKPFWVLLAEGVFVNLKLL